MFFRLARNQEKAIANTVRLADFQVLLQSQNRSEKGTVRNRFLPCEHGRANADAENIVTTANL